MSTAPGRRRAAEARRHILLGSFAVGALVVLALALALFLGGRLQGGRTTALMVFRGTVTGLEVGTPVQFRGIKIGEVREIRTLYDPDSKQVLFATVAQFTGDIEVAGRQRPIGGDGGAWISDMIERGLRARLQTKSFVTGQQMVFLDFDASSPPVFSKLGFAPIEIPTSRSAGEEITDTLRELPVREMIEQGQRLLAGINGLLVDAPGRPAPIPQLVARLNDTAGAVSQAAPRLTDELSATTREARATLQEVRRAVTAFEATARSVDRVAATGGEAVAALSRQAQGAAAQLERTLATLETAAGRVEGSMARLDHVLSEDAPLQATLSSTLAEATAAAQALRGAVDSLNRKPDALIFGRQAR